MGKTTYNEFCTSNLLSAVTQVFIDIRNDRINDMKENYKNDQALFYPISAATDTRWDKSWGFNAFNSTTRFIESKTNTILSVQTLHRKPNKENTHYQGSAKSCDSEGASRYDII